jgi:hypothetical protein
VLTDLLFEGEPIVLNRVEVGRVRGQELLSAACPFNKAADFLGSMKAGVITEYDLAGVEDRNQQCSIYASKRAVWQWPSKTNGAMRVWWWRASIILTR